MTKFIMVTGDLALNRTPLEAETLIGAYKEAVARLEHKIVKNDGYYSLEDIISGESNWLCRDYVEGIDVYEKTGVLLDFQIIEE